jgi:hypothetical protein
MAGSEQLVADIFAGTVAARYSADQGFLLGR